MFTAEALLNAGKTFLVLFGELLVLFIGISFVVALLQIYISQERIKHVLTNPVKASIVSSVLCWARSLPFAPVLPSQY